MKLDTKLLLKLATVLLILAIISGAALFISKKDGFIYLKIFERKFVNMVQDNVSKKVISVKKEGQLEKPKICNEKESLRMAKDCTFLIGDVEKHGTGFVINPGNYLITNYHVVDHYSDGYANIYYNSQFHPFRIAGFSVEDDLAIIHLEEPLPYCDWSDSDELDLAENVYAIGWPNSPYGESTITKGVFSRYTDLGNKDVKFVQTDTPINPGNSGGPLINDCGVVGVNTSKISWIDESAPSEGIGYAISSNHVKKVTQELINMDDGSVKIPTEKITQQTQTQNKSESSSKEVQNDYLNPDSKVAYNYDQVLFWEDRKIRDEAVLDSWKKAKGSEYIDKDKLDDLINNLERSLEIAKILWDGYTNSKITYAEVLALKQEYFVLSKETMYITSDLNIQGSINAYKNCVESWQNLEKEYDKDFSEQIDECEEYLEVE